MADQNKADQVKERIRQALENWGEALDGWLNRKKLRPQPIPVPVDRPYRRSRRSRY